MRTQNRIANSSASSGPVLTAYLHTISSDAAAHAPVPQCVSWLNREGRAQAEALPVSEKPAFLQQIERVTSFLANREPHEKTLVVVAGPARWTTVSLQEELPQTLHWGEAATAPLFWLTESRKHYALVAIDHSGARIFEYAPGNLIDVAEEKFIADTSQWKRKEFGHVPGKEGASSRGVQRDAFQKRVDNKTAAFCRKIARQASAFCAKHALTALVIAAPARILKVTQSALPAGFSQPLIPIDVDLAGMNHDHILKTLEPPIESWQSAHDRDVVASALADVRKRTAGIDETLPALQRGKLRGLIAVADVCGTVKQCVRCGWTERSAGPCAICGGERRQTELAEMLPALAKIHGVEINVVTGIACDELIRTAEGIVGLLQATKASARKKTQARLRMQPKSRSARKR